MHLALLLLALIGPAQAAPQPLLAPPAAQTGARARSPLQGDWPAQPSGKTVSLDDDQTANDALDRIAQAAGWSLILNAGGRGQERVHLRLKHVPVEQGLEALLQATNLVAVRTGDIVTVKPGAASEVTASSNAKAKSFESYLLDATSDVSLRKGRDKVATGDVAIGPGEQVRDLVAIRGNAKLGPGARAREVTAVMGSVELGPGSTVEQDVTAVGGDVHVSPGAHVGHDATSVGGRLIVDPGAKVGGDQTSVGLPGVGLLLGAVGAALGASAALSPFLAVGSALAKFLLYFTLGLLFLVFSPRRVESVSAALVSPGRSAVVGFFGLMAVPILALLLTITLIGIPLLAVEALAVLVAATLGFSGLAVFIGRRLPLHLGRGEQVAQLALGTAVIVLVSQLPVLGTPAMIAAWMVAFGAVLRTRFGASGALPVPPADEAPIPGAPV